MGTVVVGYVDSPECRAALRTAVAEANLRGAQVVVVHSAKGGSTLDGADSVAIKESLTEARAELRAEGVEFQIRNLIRGSEPADDLVAMVEEYGAELLVIGLRQRSSVGKLILGSNAQRVLMTAQCPVLAVKAGADVD